MPGEHAPEPWTGGAVALVGGTGRSGPGLALRWALAGVPVVIGSRDAERGAAAAAAVRERAAAAVRAAGEGAAGGGAPADVQGADNEAACERAAIALVTVPFEGQEALLPGLAGALDGKIVVSTAVPLDYDRARGPWHVDVAEGSAAEQVAALLPRSRVVAGFHSLSSAILGRTERPVGSDVVVSGDDAEAKADVMRLAERLPGVRAVDAGPLRYARHTEHLTVLLLAVNRVNRGHAGVVLTDVGGR